MRVTLYTSSICTGCHEVSQILDRLAPQYGLEVSYVDVSADQALSEAYSTAVPVIEIEGGRLGRFSAPPDERQLRLYLEVAGRSLAPSVTAGQQGVGVWRASKIDRFMDYVTHHWLRFIALATGVFVGLPWLAPIFAALGWWDPANLIYTAYAVT